MGSLNLYHNYHKGIVLQKRVINNKNFTYRNIIKVLNSLTFGNDVLDIGSGVGTIDFYLASRGKKVTGIEIAKEAIENAGESAILLGLQGYTDFIQGDFLQFKKKGNFDLIICSEVLEHLEDDKKALKKIYALLKKGGKLLVTVPSADAPLYRLGLTIRFDKRVGHLRRYRMDELISLLIKNKFEVMYKLKTEGLLRNFLFVFSLGNLPNRLSNRFPLISDILTLIDNVFLKLFGESNLIIVAKKK